MESPVLHSSKWFGVLWHGVIVYGVIKYVWYGKVVYGMILDVRYVKVRNGNHPMCDIPQNDSSCVNNPYC